MNGYFGSREFIEDMKRAARQRAQHASVTHDHTSPKLSPDAYDSTECATTLVDLPCGCQDVVYACGEVDREHDHVECDGAL